MPSSSPASPPAEPAGQRTALVRSIRRASLAGALAMIVVVVLALGVVWKARQSEQQAARADAEAARATAAQNEAAAQLWSARLNEARATRIAGGPGARQRAADLIAELARHPGLTATQRLALRSETIAQFALLDVESPTNWVAGEISACLERGLFVMASGRREVEVRRFSDSNVVARFTGPAMAGQSFFSPDGSMVATTFKTGPPALVVWRVGDGSVVISNAVHASTPFGERPPVFSPGGELIAFNTPRALEIRALTDGAVVRRREGTDACAFSPDARWLGCASGLAVAVEDTRSGEARTRVEIGFGVTQISWRPHGEVLGLAGQVGAVALASLPPPGSTARARVQTTEGHGAHVIFSGFTADGAALVTTGWDGFSFFWDALSGHRLLAESRQFVTGLGAKDQVLVMRSFPLRFASAQLMTGTGCRVVAAAQTRPQPPAGIARSGDGRWLAADHWRFTTLYDLRTGRELARLRGSAPCFVDATDTLLTCSGGLVQRFALDETLVGGAMTNIVEGDPFLQTPRGTRANSLSLSPDGATLVVCASDHSVLLVDPTNATVRREVKVAAHYASLAADGTSLVTQYHNGPSHLIHLGASNRITTAGVHLNTGFDASGRWLALVKEGELHLHERSADNHWQPRHRLPLVKGVGAPPPFAFSRDGRHLAVVFNRFEVHLYEPESARLLAVFTPAFPAQINGAAALVFSADGRELLAAKQDGEIVAWTIPTVRAALTQLGLDWGEPSGAEPLPASSRPVPRLNLWILVAMLAGTAALLAGVVVFALQRRMLAAYERAAGLAEARQHELGVAQMRLVQSQKLEALGTLAAGVAHDFNNLLSVIRMSNQLVERAVQPEGVTKENVQAIEHAVQQGKSIVNSMLGYSRRPTEVIEDFSVDRTVNETVALLSRQFLSGLTLQLELDPTCPTICGSRLRLEQALLNLIVNASEAMRGQGRLTISTRLIDRAPDLVLAAKPSSGFVEVSVSDTGPGIAPAVLPRIFEPFFTTKTAGTERGTGLGLSLVYAIAQQDGWGLDVKSEPGRGATFRLVLPISQTEFMGRPLPAARAAESAGKVSSA